MDRQQAVLEQANRSNELREKFFFHWSLLATGTFSLLIPFVQSLDKIKYSKLFVVIGCFLALSVIFSSLRNFLAAKIQWWYFEENNGETKNVEKRKKLGKINKYIEFFSIGSFILAIILTVIFVNFNVLYS